MKPNKAALAVLLTTLAVTACTASTSSAPEPVVDAAPSNEADAASDAAGGGLGGGGEAAPGGQPAPGGQAPAGGEASPGGQPAPGGQAPAGGEASPGGQPTPGGQPATGGEPSPPLENFSFFVTSLRAMQTLSGNPLGFGGDLRFGEEGPGAGLRGADKLCAAVAELSMPGAGRKPWRAFLSATDDGAGQVVNAIDRIGQGPWYDRLGRLLAADLDDLRAERPVGADPAIVNDFPNEDGVPNHAPDPTQPQVDNHDTLTGTNAMGQLFDAQSTCLDWTANAGDKAREGQPRVGHSWPRFGGPGGGGRPGGGRPDPSGGDGSPANWMSSLHESGCAPGVNLVEMGPPMADSTTVGSGGGYGGIYCFSLVP